ncbi:glycosyl transferase family 64 domain-containing protein [Fennellomyces sp. T-0311]|nr:glycosyl transferase family 64 domain-containing protein [Fennellomyces sp. T-0311]
MNIHILHTSTGDDPITQALYHYRKVVYFSSEILFKKNVDHYFGYPVNTILEENDEVGLRVYERSKEPPPLLASVNFPLSNQEVLWFNGPMKPWDFHQYHDTDWRKLYDPASFYQWRSLHDKIAVSPDSTWANQDRRKTICAVQSPGHPEDLVRDRFSVLLSTYKPERIQHLTLLIRHLLQSSLVHEIFITWHNPSLEAPQLPAEWDRVKVLLQSFNSLNNRFNPVDAIQTEAVYILDDDVFVDISDLEFTFQVWQSNHKDSIVGHFPRIHKYNPEANEAEYKVSNKDTYSMVLTKSMFVHTDYLYAYTCLMDTSIHRIIDEWTNCEDIAFNMMVSGLSGAPAVAVRPEKPLIDFGLDQGISTNLQHMGGRGECVSHFITNYWSAKDPLYVSHTSVVPYIRPQIRRGKWDHMDAILQRYHFDITDTDSPS